MSIKKFFIIFFLVKSLFAFNLDGVNSSVIVNAVSQFANFLNLPKNSIHYKCRENILPNLSYPSNFCSQGANLVTKSIDSLLNFDLGICSVKINPFSQCYQNKINDFCNSTNIYDKTIQRQVENVVSNIGGNYYRQNSCKNNIFANELNNIISDENKYQYNSIDSFYAKKCNYNSSCIEQNNFLPNTSADVKKMIDKNSDNFLTQDYYSQEANMQIENSFLSNIANKCSQGNGDCYEEESNKVYQSNLIAFNKKIENSIAFKKVYFENSKAKENDINFYSQTVFQNIPFRDKNHYLFRAKQKIAKNIFQQKMFHSSLKNIERQKANSLQYIFDANKVFDENNFETKYNSGIELIN